MPVMQMQRRQLEAKVLLGFLSAIVIVATVTIAEWALTLAAADSVHLVSQTQQIVNAVSQVSQETLNIELSTKTYRITGEASALSERDKQIDRREAIMRGLQELLSDRPQQADRWQQLREVLDERIAIATKVSFLRATEGADAANAFAAAAPLRETRERTASILKSMDEDARSALEYSTVNQLKTQRLLMISGWVGTLLLSALLMGVFCLIRRQLISNELNQRAVASREAKLVTILRSLADAVLVTDAQGRITRMNPAAERLTGWPSELAEGQFTDTVLRLHTPSGPMPGPSLVSTVLASGQPCAAPSDTFVTAQDGTVLPVSASATPIQSNHESIQGVVIVLRDTSLESHARQCIRDQNALLEKHVQERTAQLLDTQGHLSGLIGSVPAMIAFVDPTQRYVYANEQFRATFAPDCASIVGKTVREVLGEQRYTIAAPFIAKVLAGDPQNYDWQPFPGVWQSIQCVPKRGPTGGVEGYYVLGSDITQRKHSEHRIQTLNEELEQRIKEAERATKAWKTLSAGNSAMIRATDEQQLLESMCQAIAEAGGYPAAMVWYKPDDAEDFLQPMAQGGYLPGIEFLRELEVTADEGKFGRGAVATCIRTGTTQIVGSMQSEASYQPFRSVLLDFSSCIAFPLTVDDQIIGALAIFAREQNAFGFDEASLLTEAAHDLSFGIASLRGKAKRKAAEAEMLRRTRFDELTGLANGVRFTELVTHAIETAHKTTSSNFVALIQVNVERLREINDALGFAHGDQVLQEFGSRLREAAPDGSLVARLRGDEFALLLAPGDEKSALETVARVHEFLAPAFPVADILLDVSARTGIALYPAHGDSADQLLRHVDFAVHEAKRRERRFVVYDPKTVENRPERLTMAGELRRSIENGDLKLYLQPKIDFASGRLLGSEALVRWLHPERGLIQPSQFIELAESTGLIKNLTEWVIEAALRVCCEEQAKGSALPIAVNLSARNLHDPDLLNRVRLMHQSAGVGRGLLEFEITESTVMDDPESAVRILHGLRKDGMSLYIDDFGTGYSSLSYLLKLPVDYIKIDQSFVRGMSSNLDSAVIVKSTIDLAHSLGRKVVAEGVETQQDWDHLAALGCDIAQGYFVAKPMPAENFREWTQEFRRSCTLGIAA